VGSNARLSFSSNKHPEQNNSMSAEEAFDGAAEESPSVIHDDSYDDDVPIDASVTDKWRSRAETWRQLNPDVLVQMDEDDIFDMLSFRNDGNEIGFVQYLSIFLNVIREIQGRWPNVSAQVREIKRCKDKMNRYQQEIDALSVEEERSQVDGNNAVNPTGTPREQELAKQVLEMTQELHKSKLALHKSKLKSKLALHKSKLKYERNILKEMEKSIMDSRDKIRVEVTLMQFRMDRIADAHMNVENHLSVYRVKGNETSQSASQKPSVAQDANRVDHRMDAGKASINVALTAQPEVPEIKDLLLKKVGDEERDNLMKFQVFVTDLLNQAGNREYDGNEDSSILVSTIEAIIMQEKLPDTLYLRPSDKQDQEITVEQPIAYAIIYRILQIINMEAFITKEQFIPSVPGSFGARVDLLVHNFREHLPNILHVMLKGTVEVKASATGTSDQKMQQGENQTVGHLSKRALASFHFLGVGLDATLYGITFTLRKLSVVEMVLENVGTDDVSIKVGRTPRLDFQDDLDAFAILAGALKASLKLEEPALSNTLVSCNTNGNVFNELNIDGFLGSGAFAYVFATTGTNEFVKIPKQASCWKSLKREGQILQSLTGHDSIPALKFDQVCELKFALRGQVGRSIGLFLVGIVGKSADEYMKEKKGEDAYDAAGKLVVQVYDALTYAHERNIFHLDIRPSNIVVSTGMGEVYPKIMVIDWGCAAKAGDRFAFRGCVPFAHDSLLSKLSSASRPRKAEQLKSFDWASLAYTFYGLCNGHIPWAQYLQNRTCPASSDLQHRKTIFQEWWPASKPEDRFGPQICEALLGSTGSTRPQRKRK
jgi:Protein kinase domain